MAEPVYVTKKQELKYLDFLHVAAVQVILCIASLYELAKEKSGPLKGGVQTVESTVKSIVAPVYNRIHDLPLDLLCLADRKVDSVLGVVEQHVPATIKTVTFHVYTALRGFTMALCEFLSDARNSGLCAASKAAGDRYKPVAVELYKDYEPTAEQYAVVIWQYLNLLPLFPQAAHLVIPTAAHWAEKYNHAVESAGARDIVVQYLPEIPIEKIAKVFSGNSVKKESTAVAKPEDSTDKSTAVAEHEVEVDQAEDE
ncbi:stress-related protein-like isoform X2 [Carex littledalei]|uniref:Stress-related protein-like isoform X2 n=1 Tax=Carex littledalei TaxID=544730 RepID=A0A833VEI3_9POAL|nr:stress-related protein-like isoform X2 [Carex littledalei]